MPAYYKRPRLAALLFVLSLPLFPVASAQSGGSSTSVTGTVVDTTGAVVPNAGVEIRNPVSGFNRTTTTDNAGKFSIPNVPFNPYHLAVNGSGFAPYAQDVDVRSVVAVNLNITLQVKGSEETVTVEGAGEDLLENDSDLPHRCGSRSVRQTAAGKHVVFGEFAGDAVFAGNRSRFQRPVPRPGRPCGKLVLGGWPAHHRPAKQSLLQPDSARFDCNRWKSSPARRRRSLAKRPAW